MAAALRAPLANAAMAQRLAAVRAITAKVAVVADAKAGVMVGGAAVQRAITPAAALVVVVKSAALPARAVVLAAMPRQQLLRTRWNATRAKSASPKCSPVQG